MVRIKQRYLLLNILYPDPTNIRSTASTPSYLNFHAPTPEHINSQAFSRLLKAQIAHLFGDHGMGLSISSLKVIYYSQATSTAILRVPRSYFRLTWAALTMLQELPSHSNNQNLATKCVVRVVRVSGTIKKAEEELLRRSRRDLVRARLATAGSASSTFDRWTGSASEEHPSDDVKDDAVNVEDSSAADDDDDDDDDEHDSEPD